MNSESPILTCLPGAVALRATAGMEVLRDQKEIDLQSKGRPMPAYHRRVWADAVTSKKWSGRSFGFVHGLSAREEESRVLRLESWRSRSVPGYRNLRVPHLGHFVPMSTFESSLSALVDYSRRSRVLRLTVEIFDSEARCRIERARVATRLGLKPNAEPSQYATTLRVDLERSPEELLASFSRRCRRAIRKFEASAYRVDRITEAGFDQRIQELSDETFGRTQGMASQADHDWCAIRSLQMEAPDVACLIGIFDDRLTGPESLVGVAYGLHHGDFAVYELGASRRRSGVDATVGYSLVWQLIRWAQEAGAHWFDLGGCWRNPAPEVAGIEAFKRSFSKDEIVVRDEYVLEPYPMLAGFDRAIRGLRHKLRAMGTGSK